MSGQIKVVAAAALTLGAGATIAQAAITPLDSASFTDKYEMTNPAELHPGANTANWTIYGGGTASLTTDAGENVLRYDTDGAPGDTLYWDLNSPATYYTHASGSTFEIRLRVDTISTPNEGDNAMQVFLGDGSAFGVLVVGLNSTSFVGSGVLTNSDNTDGYHIFRVAQDQSSDTFHVWRDGVLISGAGLPGITHSAHSLYLVDGTGGYGSTGSVDYFRFNSGGYSPIPEPASLGALALGGLLAIRRRD